MPLHRFVGDILAPSRTDTLSLRLHTRSGTHDPRVSWGGDDIQRVRMEGRAAVEAESRQRRLLGVSTGRRLGRACPP